MNNETTHSKAKLALAIITSPGAAFEEINRRKLLGAALVICVIAGALSAVPVIITALSGERVQALTLGKSNPVTWVGLTLLFAFAMQKLLKWIGTEVEYVGLLMLMGWSQVTLIVAQLAMIALSYSQSLATTPTFSVNFAFAILATASLGYVFLMGLVVHTLTGAPKARGMMAYAVVLFAAAIGFSQTYVTAKISPFADALPGIAGTARLIAGADQTPWAVAAVVGLTLGAILISKSLQWPAERVRMNAIMAGLVGVVMLGVYLNVVYKTDYYGKLRNAHESYIHEKYKAAAAQMEALLPIIKDNYSLMLDAADVNLLANQDKKALELFGRAVEPIKHGNVPDKKQWLARLYDGEGAALYAMGDYDTALGKFEQAKKQWPEFREPWVRMAVTYDKMGKYDKAISAGNYAVQNLGSKATVVWVALAEAFANKGDEVQAATAITMVKSSDEKLAGRIGENLEDWKSAVSKLNRVELGFPLEKELASEPGKAEKSTDKKKKS